MKFKIFVMALACFACVGCLSVPYDSLKFTSSNNTAFTINRQTYNSLKGNFTVYAYPIYFTKPGLSSESDVITLTRTVHEDESFYFTIIHTYWGNDWRFMKKMLMMIDSKLIELEDKSPSHTVGYPTASMVQERLTYLLPNDQLEDLQKCSSLKIEYYGEPIVIDQTDLLILKEAIAKMRELPYVPKKIP
jgi:hypothetical protein